MTNKVLYIGWAYDTKEGLISWRKYRSDKSIFISSGPINIIFENQRNLVSFDKHGFLES